MEHLEQFDFQVGFGVNSKKFPLWLGVQSRGTKERISYEFIRSDVYLQKKCVRRKVFL